MLGSAISHLIWHLLVTLLLHTMFNLQSKTQINILRKLNAVGETNYLLG
jgi:hypothetical protein